jgi:pimeloyl-ACP methyl ester carboxylesterase
MALFLWVLLAIVIMVAAIYLLQGKFIYYPHRYSVASLSQAAGQYSLTLWPTPDEHYRGLVSRNSTGPRGTIIVFHGNGGSALNRLHYLAALESLGFRVILAEYPGYGAREGEPSERVLVADALATVQEAQSDFAGPLYLWGESLGSGVATALAADSNLPVEGVALITPFTSLTDVAQSVYWFLPLKWLLRDRYDNLANLRGFKGPVAILVAGRDELIPAQQAQDLYDSLATPKRMWVFEEAGHNSWPAAPGENWSEEVATFLTE